jgi:hypothetical protein
MDNSVYEEDSAQEQMSLRKPKVTVSLSAKGFANIPITKEEKISYLLLVVSPLTVRALLHTSFPL